MELRDSLRLAASDPPPTAIDVDALLEGEHRAARRRRWLGTAGAAAGVVTAIAVGVALIGGYGGSPRGTPVGGPGPTAIDRKSAEPGPQATPRIPTEPASAAIPRLSEAFRQALRALSSGPGGGQLPVIEPDLSVLPPQHGPTPDPSSTPPIETFSGGPESGYKALYTLTDSAGYSSLLVVIQAAPMPLDTACVTNDAMTRCTVTTGPDGSKIYSGQPNNAVELYRPDGTHITVMESNVKSESDGPEPDKTPRSVTTRPQPALTLDQLVSLASAPGLTLFP